MLETRRLPPVWLMGVGVIPTGGTGAIGLITTPTLLATAHTREADIAWVTSMYLTPGFVSFLLGPLIDWRWPRRAYAVLLAVVAAACQFLALLFVHDLTAMGWLLF